MSMRELITDHLDLWTGAVTTKSTAGRGSSSGKRGKIELTGIKKLRELILELAVRGKLVEQVPNDEPASVLLERIAEEKARLVKEGKIKKPKKLPEITEEEKPFELPEGWVWTRFDNIAFPQAGFAFKSKNFNETGEGLPIIRIRDVGQPFSGTYYSGEYRDEFLVEKGEYLISMDGIFRVAKNDLDLALLNQRVTRLKFLSHEVSQDFFANSLQLRLNDLQGIKAYTTVDHLSGKQISESLVGVPPEEEQQRIVDRFNELMALCDRLEQQVGDQLEAHEVLVDTLLDALTRSADAVEVADNWARTAEHFDTLFTTETSIEKLKNTILQLAVTGKLTEQNQGDEPAQTAYEKKPPLPKNYVRKPKQKIKDRPITSLEKLPKIPPSWAYFSIDQLYDRNHILDYADGNHGSLYPKKGDFGDEGAIFLTAAQISDFGEINWRDCPRLSYEKANKLSKGWSQKGDIFFTHNATVGRTGLASAPPEDDFLLGTSVTFYRVNNESLSRDYLYYYFSSPLWQDQASAIMQQTTRNQVSITKQALFYVSLPPMNEQRRVVKRVRATMSLCDQLKARLGEAGETRTQLAEAVVEQAVN